MATKKTSTPPKKTAAKKTSASKATSTKTVSKKTAPKKPVTKSVTTPPKTPSKTTTNNQSSGLFHVLYVIIIGMLLILLVINGSNMDSLKKNGKEKKELINVLDTNEDFIVYKEQTWMKIEGNPLELIIVNDPKCGPSCDPSSVIETIKQNITPAIITKNIDVDSQKGKEFVEQFDIMTVPTYILGQGASTFEKGGGIFVDQNAPLFNAKNGLYAFSNQAGFPIGKFIKKPEINIENQPQLGSGPVTVIEFTDYQCPYCKRLHDNTSSLMNELIAEGKVTYVIKDFPLPFHKEAMPVHAALNCVQADSGNEAYFAMKSTIFDDQSVWASKSNDDLVEYLVDLGSDNGAADISACITSLEANEEIASDIAEGSKYGVRGTPGIFVGSQFAPGAISAEQLRSMIEAESGK